MGLAGLDGSLQLAVPTEGPTHQLAGLRRRADMLRTGSPDELRERMQELVGGVFFGLLIKQMRKTLSGSAYFHGGQGEKIFRGQFDQEIARRRSDSLPAGMIDPMVEQLKWRLQGTVDANVNPDQRSEAG